MNLLHVAKTPRLRGLAGATAAGMTLVLAGFQAPASHRPNPAAEFTPQASFEPTLQAPRVAGGQMELRYWLEPGHAYELRATGVLGGAPIVLTNHTVKFIGLEALYLDPLSEDQRFYQLVITGDVD